MHVYMYRHQAGGILTEIVFLERPTDAQLAPLRARMAQLHGTTHRRTGERYWDTIIELTTLAPGAVPAYPEPAGGTDNDSRLSEFSVSGVGTVTPAGSRD